MAGIKDPGLMLDNLRALRPLAEQIMRATDGLEMLINLQGELSTARTHLNELTAEQEASRRIATEARVAKDEALAALDKTRTTVAYETTKVSAALASLRDEEAKGRATIEQEFKALRSERAGEHKAQSLVLTQEIDRLTAQRDALRDEIAAFTRRIGAIQVPS